MQPLIGTTLSRAVGQWWAETLCSKAKQTPFINCKTCNGCCPASFTRAVPRQCHTPLTAVTNAVAMGLRQLRPPSVATPLSQRVSLADLQALPFQSGPLTDGAKTLASLTGASGTADGHDGWPSKRRLLASVTRRSVWHLL